jgi:hypothetical protein
LKKQAQHIDFRGLFLSLLILLAFSTKELHHIFSHHHAEVKICHTQAGEKHFHNEEYIHDECSLCDFTFSAFETPTLAFQSFLVKTVFIERVFTYQSFILSRSYLFQALRAPPASRTRLNGFIHLPI